MEPDPDPLQSASRAEVWKTLPETAEPSSSEGPWLTPAFCSLIILLLPTPNREEKLLSDLNLNIIIIGLS